MRDIHRKTPVLETLFNSEYKIFSTSISETSENVYLFVFISWLVSFGVCMYIQWFFDVVINKHQTISICTRVNRKKIKVQDKNMSCTRALNFDQWKTFSFSENYKSMRAWLWFTYKSTENYYRLQLFSEFTQTQKRYPTSFNKIGLLT